MTIDPAVRAVAALGDELRHAMYTFIRAARRPVTRDEAATAAGISRKLAAFHLDKLVDAGVLQADFQPVAGVRRVGRAPKVYRPVDADISVGIPPRQHDLLADILLDAVLAQEPNEDSRSAALRVARERGVGIGAAERARSRPGRLGAERALAAAGAALQRHGFEPDRATPACVRLQTCPFHPLAARAPEMVCGINHALLDGLVEGLDTTSVHAVLDPRAGECCVELRAGQD